MRRLHPCFRSRAAGVAVVLVLTATQSWSVEAVWHCSRVKATASSSAASGGKGSSHVVQQAPALALPAIELTLNDLIDAYSGQPVRVRGAPLTACFMRGASPLAHQAMKTLGLSSPQVQALGRRNALVDSSLRGVHNEAEMAACIAANFPAVGYLANGVDNAQVLPCF